MADFYISQGTRAKYRPSPDAMNISMDFNASPSGGARGTEVIIPDNASPSVRAAAERYNQLVAGFAEKHGISNYPVRGVRTRSENKRGVPYTIHTEPFFSDDAAMQKAVQANPAEFSALYRTAFGEIPNARLIAPHGVGKDRGASSSVFGDETSYGELMANSLLGQPYSASPQATASTQGAAPMMMQQQEEKPRGLLGSLGIQKMEEGAEGETGQRFYQRDTFKDTAAILAQGFGRMGIMGMEEIADNIAKQRTENKARNKTLEYLAQMPNGDQLVELAKVAGPKAVAEFVMKQSLGGGSEDPAEIRTLKYRAEAAGLVPGTPEFQQFMLAGGGGEGGSGPAAYEALRLRARDAGLEPNTPEYQQFMRTGGTGDTVASQDKSAEAKRLADEQKDLAFYAAGERALSAINENTLVPATGVVADYLKDTPFGQAQTDVAENLAIMESQMQFETLANLKAASPNGSSGLGQLTEAERRALGKLYANFDNRQSEPAVARAIKSSLLLRSYFKNGLYDPTMETPGYRNATPEEMDQMAKGINPFTASDGPQLKGVKSFGAPAPSGGAQKTKTGVTYKVLD